MRLLRCGRDALLVETDHASAVPALTRALRDVEGVVECVPGARTVLVRTVLGVDRLRTQLADVRPDPGGADDDADPITVDVRYDGPDLADVAAHAGLDTDGLVRLHTGTPYVVAFCGFVPGFAYLTGLDPRLQVPRLPEPRTRVPAGAVGVASEFTGAYPRPSPGGWRLLGSTDAALWDVTRDPPALLTPGRAVRLRAVP